MNRYDYRCNKCGDFEIEQSIKDKALTQCPHCKCKQIERLISAPYIIIPNDNTIYSLAKNNTKNVSKEQIDKYNESCVTPKKDNLTSILKKVAPKAEIKSAAKPQWYNPKGENLSNKLKGKTKKQIQKYIKTGEL